MRREIIALDIRSTATNQSKFWEMFWFIVIACEPIVDQISSMFRGGILGQILSISLCFRAGVGVCLVIYILGHSFQNMGSVQCLGRRCILFSISVLYVAVFRWNSEVIALLFRICWWLTLLYATYSAIQSGIIRRSVLLNAMVVCVSIQLLSLLATPLIGHLGMGVRESTYVEVGAVSGLFYSTKGVGQSLALMLPVIWFRFKIGFFRSAYIFAILLGVTMTFSRTALLAALVSLTILVLTGSVPGRRKAPQRIALLVILLVFLLVTVAAIVILIGWERISYRWTMGIGTGSFGSGRLEFWRSAFLAWWRGDIVTILFGKGLGASLDILEESYGRIWCHNDFLEVLLCQGLVGVIVYIALLLYIIKLLCGSKRVNQNNGPAWALVGGFLTCSFLSGMLYQLDVIGTFIVASAAMSPISHNLLTTSRFKPSENLQTGNTS